MVRLRRSIRWTLALLTAASTLHASSAQEPPVRYEHRVAVSTTSLDREAEVEASLERNVNQLGAAGFEVTAIAGGSGPVLDQLLDRKAYVAGLVDHSGHVFVVMSRPIGRPARPLEYRLLHTRTPRGTDTIVAGLGPDYRLVATASEGGVFHAAFERSSGGPPVEYRVLANRGRTSWMAQMQNDSALMARVTRVAPMGLDHALVELGAAVPSPGAIEWMSSQAFRFTGQESALQAKARAGFHVQTVRVRGNEIDTLLLKPAGWNGTAPTYDLDDGPWGMPCSRGRIAGADVFTDGDTYCAAENPGGGVSNRGLDLRLRSESTAGGRRLFDAPSCGTRARLGSSRLAFARIAVATQLERELNRQCEPGYRATRVLAGVDASGTMRVSVFTSNQPETAGAGGSPPADAPLLLPDRDEIGDGSNRQLEEELNAALARNGSIGDAEVWVEVAGAGARRTVRLAGCATTRLDKEQAERALRTLLVRSAAANASVRNDIIVEAWR
jgi:hypothetical protein